MDADTVICEHCGRNAVAGAGKPWFLTGLLLASLHGVRPVVGCAPCFRREVVALTLRNAVLGWWSLPWGLLTPVVVLQNLLTLVHGPSPHLAGMVRPPPATAPEDRATRHLTLSTDDTGGIWVDIAPDKLVLPPWAVGAALLVAFTWGGAGAALSLAERELGVAAVVAAALGGGYLASLAAAAMFGQQVRRTRVRLADGRVTLALERLWRTETWSAAAEDIERVEVKGRSVVLRGPQEARISMSGRHPRGVQRIAQELQQLVHASRVDLGAQSPEPPATEAPRVPRRHAGSP